MTMTNISTDEDAYTDSARLYAACSSTDPQVQQNAYTTLWQYLCRVAMRIVYDQPDTDALAQDCAQVALIRVHERLPECANPAAFHAWARRIVANVAIDELRRQKRLVPLADDDEYDDGVVATSAAAAAVAAAASSTAASIGGTPGVEQVSLDELRALLQKAPISARSSRVVVGRYFDNQPDETLARTESRLAGTQVLPSHVQVTRTKDMERLRRWEPLRTYLKPPEM
jgi:RNA polymerase sigma factor (sigma-70 family)